MKPHEVVLREAWLDARLALLLKEKEFTRLRDELSRRRRDLPWVAVSKPYRFEGPGGPQTLPELFAGRSQLIVYHFMFDPSWEQGCAHCSFWADNFSGIVVHLNHRDVTMVAVSRAPFSKLAAYKKRMGWSFTWVSSFETDFNRDYQVTFTPDEVANKAAFYNYTTQTPPNGEAAGLSVFYKDESGDVFHTYSAYARGIDIVNGAYHWLDMVPNGRDEAGQRNPQFWVRRHDEYGR